MTPDPKPNRSLLYTNSIPLADTRELGDHTGWELWEQAVKRSEAQFAETAPMTAPFPIEGGDRRYAPTEVSALTPHGASGAAPRQARKVGFDEVLTEARKSNRVCPKPIWWNELYARMPEWAPGRAKLPPPPLDGQMWDMTPAIAKRMSFRDHVEWADRNRCLDKMFDFLKALPEDAWHHMGD